MKPKPNLPDGGGLFTVAVVNPIDRKVIGYTHHSHHGLQLPSPTPSSALQNTNMPYIVMVIQAVIIFITLTAFILYVFSPRVTTSTPPTEAPAFTLTFEGPPNKIYENLAAENQSQITLNHHSHTMLGKFRKAAVVSDHGICSEIGRSILTKGGNAIDTAIATLICVGVTNPQSSGIGGGFFMQIYQKDRGFCTTINSRETAPMGINVTWYQKHPEDTSYGWKSIGVPGEIKGFWRAFQDYGSGKVQWKELLEPTVKLCREGIPVSEYLANILMEEKEKIILNNELKVMFTNPNTNELYKEAETMYRPNLASTLQRLADAPDPSDLFYSGEMAETIVKEIQEGGGYLTLEDLEDFEPSVKTSVTSSLSDDIIQCGPPPPSSWIVTQLIVKIMEELYPPPRHREDLDTVLFYHRLIEAEKFAYAQRTKLGDPYHIKRAMDIIIANLTDPATARSIAAKISDSGPLPDREYGTEEFVKEDHGTSHVSVIDSDGNAVAVTSTINLWLGSRVASSLGIIWNDQMDDFSVPGQTNAFGFEPSKANLMAAGKTPMSSMSPTIVYNNTDKQVRVVIGTTGGSKIIQGVASVVVRSLLFGQSIKEAIDSPQIFHQITPPHVQYEKDFPKHIIDSLRSKGHVLKEEQNMHSTTHAIFVDGKDGYIYANSDKRSHVHMHPDGF